MDTRRTHCLTIHPNLNTTIQGYEHPPGYMYCRRQNVLVILNYNRLSFVILIAFYEIPQPEQSEMLFDAYSNPNGESYLHSAICLRDVNRNAKYYPVEQLLCRPITSTDSGS